MNWKAIALAGGLGFALMKIGAATQAELADYPVSVNLRGHENTEWSTSYAYHLRDAQKSLPRVLLIGDSICQGYQSGVCSALEGKMSVTYWASSYCVTSPCYLKFLSIYLDEAEYSVIHFNNGCHSLSTSTEDWEKGLRAAFMLIKLKQPKARIVWTTTTPNRDAENNAKIVRMNEIAAKVVAEFGNITVDDLFSLMNPLDRTLYWSDNFHFKEEAIDMQVKQVADACLKAMEDGERATDSLGYGRPFPRPALLARIKAGVEVYGIVHWGLNTYTDREWGYGDEDPEVLNPMRFDADQIVGACRAGGLQGLIIVAKHHDGFCLWPTKTTEHNITKSPFRGGKGDYVREMAGACRKAGMKFGVYVSPWDRNSPDYGTAKYVETYHAQIKELLGGNYGEVFEMWFDGANGGDGYYGGAREKRRIPDGYYRFDEVFKFVRELQPKVCIFAGEHDTADFRWPGNERGELSPDSRATICTVGGYADGKYGNPDYGKFINTGCADGRFFKMCEADFPLRPGWFYHAKERGKSKHAAYLMNRYLVTVGNGGTMNIGIAPNKDGLLDEEDVKALKGFDELRKAFFANEVTDFAKPFNLVVLREDVSKGEQVDDWSFLVNDEKVLSGKSIGHTRIRILDRPMIARRGVRVAADKGVVSYQLYSVDPELVQLVQSATTESGETDTAKWMTGVEREMCP